MPGILADARRAANMAVNSAMIAAHWKIGRRNVEEEPDGAAKATYGEKLLKALSNARSAEFTKGFSLANLKNCRSPSFTYAEGGKCYTLLHFWSWTHHRLILRVASRASR